MRERALRDWFERELITPQGFRGQVLAARRPTTPVGQVLELLTAAHLLRAETGAAPSGTSSRTTG